MLNAHENETVTFEQYSRRLYHVPARYPLEGR